MNLNQQPLIDSWPSFVYWAARQYSSGLSEIEAGKLVEGVRISWQGRVRSNNANEEIAPSVTVDMESVSVSLADGRTFVGDYLSLPIDEQHEKFACNSLKQGDLIDFTVTIGDESGAFPAIGFAEDPEQSKVFLETALRSVTVSRTRTSNGAGPGFRGLEDCS